MAENTRLFLSDCMSTLADAGIRTWLFGGWAEELRGLCSPRPHKDIDLLYPAYDFSQIEGFIKERDFEEIAQKRFVHKRAFIWNGVLLEIILVQRRQDRIVTDFFDLYRFEWPADTLADVEPFPIASKTALRVYRQKHARIEEAYRCYLAGGKLATESGSAK
jgi:hypothetical protein